MLEIAATVYLLFLMVWLVAEKVYRERRALGIPQYWSYIKAKTIRRYKITSNRIHTEIRFVFNTKIKRYI